MKADALARLPSVDRVLRWPLIAALAAHHGRAPVLDAARAALAACRAAAMVPDDAALCADIEARVQAALAPSLRPVLNLTGTVLHTNLGRAPLPRGGASTPMVQVACRRLEPRVRPRAPASAASATAMSRSWLCRLTGAEAATVVNNNAAAVLLALNTPGARREVHRLARRADRDRRRVPAARHHGPRRLPAARGRHHQPHPPARLCRGDRPAHRRCC